MLSIELQTAGFIGVVKYECGATSDAAVRSHNLVDPAAAPTLHQRPVLFGAVPYLTDHGTFIHNGTEYALRNQLRLRPGIFTRRKENGEIESHVNPEKGFGHRLNLDPKTGIYRINIGQSQIPLLPLMRAFGATDDDIRDAWGEELLHGNDRKASPHALAKLYEKLYRKKPESGTNIAQAVTDSFRAMTLDPEVTGRTLGQPFKNIDLPVLLAATRRLREVSRDEADPDDRDALAYQKFIGPEDLFAESIRKSGHQLRNVLWKATGRGDLSNVPARWLEKSLQGTLLRSGLGMPLEMVNPAELLDAQSSVTRLGRGGLPGSDSIPIESRNVQPTQLGYIDFIRTPECYDDQTLVMTRCGWKPWPAVTIEDELACLVEGELQFHKPARLTATPYTGTMYGGHSTMLDYLVTPCHRMLTRPDYRGSGYRFDLAKDIHGRCRVFKSGGHAPVVGLHREHFQLPTIVKLSNSTKEFGALPFDDWAEFMGWYLSEGSMHVDRIRGHYSVRISQSRVAYPQHYDRIDYVLSRLPFAYSKTDIDFTIVGKQLAEYLGQFGRSRDKWIPDELFMAHIDSRQRLYDALLRGDGSLDRRGRFDMYSSTSERLAAGVQRLAFSLGHSSFMSFAPDRREQYEGCHVVHIHERNERELHKTSSWTGQPYHYTQQYSGLVYGASVPGGLLYVRRGDCGGFWCGDGNVDTNRCLSG